MEGDDLTQLDLEAGGHRIQRVPPTERKGRVHTSSVTVSVINPTIKSDNSYHLISDEYFRVEWFAGTGCGGQHKNKHQNSCRLYHIPTGLVQSKQGRKRESNLRDAKAAILLELENLRSSANHAVMASARKDQIGSGMRGDKIRTYRLQDDIVTDHIRGTRAKCTKVLKGEIDLLWE